MMKFLKHFHFTLFLLTGIFTANLSMAQCDLKRYQELIKEGDAYLTRQEPDYKQAMNAYSAAMTACKDKMPEVQKKIVGLFDKINLLKKNSFEALAIAETEKQHAKDAQSEAHVALSKVNKIINSLYFYKDRFALAVNISDDGSKYRYGFINKQGNTVIDFKYSEAQAFDVETGFAKVRESGDVKFSWIDTNGRKYSYCDEIDSLNETHSIIDFRHKKLKVLPENVFKNKHLKVILLSDNLLEKVPDAIADLDSLVILDLSKNKIKEMPAGIGNCKSLIKLDLCDNKLESLPGSIGMLRNLEILRVNDNYLFVLPSEICNLVNLNRLDLYGNHPLGDLPAEIGNLKNIEVLDFQDCYGIKSIPSSIGKMKKLRYLNLYFSDITCLPREFGELSGLRSLKITGNQNLYEVPETIGNLKNLTELTLAFNRIESLPVEIGNLKNLTYLTLNSNKLKSIPETIGLLDSLKILYLSGNDITTLPAQIGKLKHLTYLYLEENNFCTLPSELGQLCSLEYLGLKGNRLTSLPLEISNLKNLEKLSLMDNPLSELPAEIGQLSKLRTLVLNSQKFPPSEQEKLQKLLPECDIRWVSDSIEQKKNDSSLRDRKVGAVDKLRSKWSCNPEKYTEPLATALVKLASFEMSESNRDKAKAAWSEALSLYRGLAKTNPDKYTPMVASTLDSLVDYALYPKNSSIDSISVEAEVLYRNLEMKHPGKFTSERANSLVNLAWVQYKWDPNGAINNLQEAINIYKILVRTNRRLNLQLARCYANYSYFNLFKRNFVEGEKLARLSIETDTSYKKVARNLAPNLLFQGKFEEASSIYLEFKAQKYSKYYNFTYKDIFLFDLDKLEKAGISHPDVVKIRELLNM